jgi:hypothetical protein
MAKLQISIHNLNYSDSTDLIMNSDTIHMVSFGLQ